MTIRRIIDLIESAADENITHRIAAEVGGGTVEGFNPYWKLTADPRVLEDAAALDHISTLIMDGFTSGIHPTWELKLIDSTEAVVDEEVLLPAGTPDVSGAVEEEEPLDEEVIDIVHAFSVVPVAETHGKGKGWYEVSEDAATHFVIEDEEGHMVEHHPTYEAAKVAADIMNQNLSPSDMKTFAPVEEEMIDEEADEMVADEVVVDTDAPTRFDKAQDFVVIINAIHERGVRQQEALTELGKRGLWLSDEQKRQADLD